MHIRSTLPSKRSAPRGFEPSLAKPRVFVIRVSRHLRDAVARLLAVALGVGLLAASSLYWCRFDANIPTFWPANALPLAILLARRPSGWRPVAAVIAAAMAGDILACLVTDAGLTRTILLPVANAAEIAAACAAAWAGFGPRPRIRRLDGLARILISIGLIGPAVGGSLIAAEAALAADDPMAGLVWFMAHALGNILFTTAGLVLLNRTATPLLPRRARLRATLALALSLALSVLTFHQSSLPPLFIMPLVFAALAIIAGLEFTCVAIALIALSALFRTAMGHGPIAAIEPSHIGARILLLQAFLAASFIAAIPIALLFERHTRIIARLRDQKAAIVSRAARFQGLAEIAADTIVVTLVDGTILYASPAAQRLIGVTGDALAGRSAFDLVAPEDLAAIRAAMASLGGDTTEITAELRLRHHATAAPVWTEIKTRIGARRADQSVELVSVVRDISARRAAEERRDADLLRLDRLANTDSLTGLANRRRFTAHLESEWRRAYREGIDIALILIDVDLFKPYNDLYGHPMGDRALQQIAAIVEASALRTADLACRIGGEEFAVILPLTFQSGARAVAERIRDGIRDIHLIHEKSPSGVLSVSIGIDCVRPDQEAGSQSLIERADKALYRAKQRRGSIVIAT